MMEKGRGHTSASQVAGSGSRVATLHPLTRASGLGASVDGESPVASPRCRQVYVWAGRQASGSLALACRSHTWRPPRLPQPTPIRNSLYIILICLWGPGRKVMRLLLLLYFGWKLQPPLYKLHIVESTSFF